MEKRNLLDTNLEQQTYEALKQSKEKLRHYLRNLSPTGKSGNSNYYKSEIMRF